jgi:hypothetical protein
MFALTLDDFEEARARIARQIRQFLLLTPRQLSEPRDGS